MNPVIKEYTKPNLFDLDLQTLPESAKTINFERFFLIKYGGMFCKQW